MTVIETADGFVVVDGTATLAGPFPTNAEAWRAADRLDGSPISPAEKRADWISTKILSAGPAPRRSAKAIRKSADSGGISRNLSRKEKREAKKQRKAENRLKINAAKAPGWLRKGASAKFDPQAKRAFSTSQLGTFGAASPVRHVNINDYLASKGVPQ
ncbi:hypothetical protein EN904_14815 [Mesorhizobium sp. M7A.F.Ca.CA.001.07.2.1]|uniref:hypothetical protein n=1 Tax=Mesorhizobium TaxID=68287 RepID=UPI000FCB925F|nr:MULTISPECIES: hypothetical protein [Mesorhizobium]RVC30445.1 hypothetical protein EN893_12535 [Mesorhizobium sp. M7A.F.Ca.CA.004.04.2.1]MCF6124374.1 hypothetical protein [Mesorhizobium ciceri]MCQ8816665.1 hypothetical protein [Mesorhizobium sp. SEMIA396]RUX82463.1 hypothetical protein EN983_01125 [Mesorhizobium sp. M7A.F.Ca.CA.004.08.2.1]RUX87226.1 hypothetical protein EN982_11790 [Mesorhizobium sp. M7A.F.Ca.CA.004.08.1.1]